MRVIAPKDGDLPNAEVLAHLQSMRRRFNKQALVGSTSSSSNINGGSTTLLKSGNLETVIRELEEYLTSETSHFEHNMAPDLQQINDLVQASRPFELTKGEVLQILNLRPDNIVVLDTIIEEMDERLTEERQLQLLRIVRKIMGGTFVTPALEGQDGSEDVPEMSLEAEKT